MNNCLADRLSALDESKSESLIIILAVLIAVLAKSSNIIIACTLRVRGFILNYLNYDAYACRVQSFFFFFFLG